MSNATKQYLSGAMCVVCAIFMSFCASQMIPYGLAGEVGKVKLYFILMLVALAVGLPCGVAYYYFRSRRREETSLDRLRIEAEILAHAGQTPTQPTQVTSEPNPPSNLKQ